MALHNLGINIKNDLRRNGKLTLEQINDILSANFQLKLNAYKLYHILTSLFLYRELIISFIIRLTSAWKANFSAFSLSSFICATFKPSSLMASSSLWTASSSVFEPSLLLPTSSSTVGGSVSVFSSVFSSSAKQRAKKWTKKLVQTHVKYDHKFNTVCPIRFLSC